MRLPLLLPLLLVAGCATSPAGSAAPPAAPPADAPSAAAPLPHDWTLAEEQELMRAAMRVHRQQSHGDAVELLEHGLHARELAVSGRTDEEALHVRRTAPKQEMLRRQLRRAAEILVDAGHDDLAARMTALSDDLWDDSLAGTEQRRPPQPTGRDREIAMVKERMEVLTWAAEIWSEHDRNDIVNRLELALAVRRNAVEGRRDDEARKLRERAPNDGDLAEILHGAGRLYAEKGWETRAAACTGLAETFGAQWRKQQAEREGKHEGARDAGPSAENRELAERLRRFMERTERLEVQVRKLTERLEALESRTR